MCWLLFWTVSFNGICLPDNADIFFLSSKFARKMLWKQTLYSQSGLSFWLLYFLRKSHKRTCIFWKTALVSISCVGVHSCLLTFALWSVCIDAVLFLLFDYIYYMQQVYFRLLRDYALISFFITLTLIFFLTGCFDLISLICLGSSYFRLRYACG